LDHKQAQELITAATSKLSKLTEEGKKSA